MLVAAMCALCLLLAGCDNAENSDDDDNSESDGSSQNVIEVNASTTAEAIAAVKNLQAGQTLKLNLGDNVTLTEELALAIYDVPTDGKIEMGLPKTFTLETVYFFPTSTLTAINVDEENPNYSSVDGVVYNKDKTKLVVCPGGKTGSFSIPNGVTSIGDYAFLGCISLTSVNIPSSVTSIDSYAFYDCTSLTSATVNSETPPSVGYGCFGYRSGDSTSVIPGLKIYVPASAVDTYKAAQGWSDYADIILPIQ